VKIEMALLRDACQSGKRDFVGWPVFSKNGVHDVSLRLVLSWSVCRSVDSWFLQILGAADDIRPIF
jgi:hypothetical protein